MEETLTINKNRKLPPLQDYELLRKTGMAYIEELGNTLWTDYNEHDPGITILEALCYAMTEAGYRTGFDMKDLLSKPDGTIVDGQVMYSAKQILTNNPLTINDYRKLLIDIKGVHNAWLLADDMILDEQKNPAAINEIPLFADCKKDKLTTDQTANPIFLSGLYRVLLDLDHDDRFGDLNTGEIIIGNPPTATLTDSECWLSISLPSWKEADFDFATRAANKDNITNIDTNAEGRIWKCTVTLTDTTHRSFFISITKQPSSGRISGTDITDIFDNNALFVSSVFTNYLTKISLARNIVKKAIKKLHEKRNLCEDFLTVTTIEDEKIAFCLDIDVTASTDIEKVQAEVFFEIENYLNPSVDFLSLREMLDRKTPVDEIFNGTVLEHGFIDTAQLESTQLRKVIYSSDIINLLMDIDGVVAVRNFVMTKYDENGNPVTGFTGLKWCMNIAGMHKPVLSTDSSKILFFKNQFPFIANYAEIKDSLMLLYAERSRDKLRGLYGDLAMPEGKKRDTYSYWPVQYDFPQTYGIGRFGLPESASQERIAQQRQLKAYLMFFEQLLADYLSQLTHAHRLFSTASLTHSYHAKFLADIKDIDAIYKQDDTGALLKKIITATDANIDEWHKLYESQACYEDRRNRFLDHLLARFAESFSEYALMMYRINYTERTEERLTAEELINAKIRTLQNYPAISSERGKAFNYFPQQENFHIDNTALWDTNNVSGLEKRIGVLTGIKDLTRRFLYCISNIEIICTEESKEENGEEIIKCIHSFSFTSLSGTTMKSGKYEKKADAEKAVMDTIELGKSKLNFLFDTTDSTLEIIGHSNESLVKSTLPFDDRDKAMAEAEKIAAEFSKVCNDPVGLHLIEHILLRPRSIDFDLMEVCLDGCECICDLDPYSFRVSVVLPYWPGHFDSMPFREYFENKIHEEAPAHVMLKVCWLSNDLMRDFEIAYKNWIEALAAYSFSKTPENLETLSLKNNKMLNILKNLHSEYPLANLHDCIESKEGSNTVILGKTILGTFKN